MFFQQQINTVIYEGLTVNTCRLILSYSLNIHYEGANVENNIDNFSFIIIT